MSDLTASMPPVQYADVNGVRMAYYEVGPRGVGTPVVFCHGFPEIAFS
jgi:pimeloyl-ACP methyl ester carboxylesterase